MVRLALNLLYQVGQAINEVVERTLSVAKAYAEMYQLTPFLNGNGVSYTGFGPLEESINREINGRTTYPPHPAVDARVRTKSTWAQHNPIDGKRSASTNLYHGGNTTHAHRIYEARKGKKPRIVSIPRRNKDGNGDSRIVPHRKYATLFR